MERGSTSLHTRGRKKLESQRSTLACSTDRGQKSVNKQLQKKGDGVLDACKKDRRSLGHGRGKGEPWPEAMRFLSRSTGRGEEV